MVDHYLCNIAKQLRQLEQLEQLEELRMNEIESKKEEEPSKEEQEQIKEQPKEEKKEEVNKESTNNDSNNKNINNNSNNNKKEEKKRVSPFRNIYFYEGHSTYDGKNYVEEHRERVTDSEGKVHISQRRRLGDRWYENESITDSEGKTSTKESWHNVPEDQIEQFKLEWSKHHNYENKEKSPSIKNESPVKSEKPETIEQQKQVVPEVEIETKAPIQPENSTEATAKTE